MKWLQLSKQKEMNSHSSHKKKSNPNHKKNTNPNHKNNTNLNHKKINKTSEVSQNW